MEVLEDMADITAEHAGEKLRYFAGADPTEREVRALYVREDVEWDEYRRREVDSELDELVARETYEKLMDAENVNQIIKVADGKILFTGFVGDYVAVAAFDRGVLPLLPDVVGAFREYMTEHDVDFVALEA